MKIYSKFYDYYDSSGGMDFDDDIEFMRVRKFKGLEEVFPINKEKVLVRSLFSRSFSCVNWRHRGAPNAKSYCEHPLRYGSEIIHGLHKGVVGFCGKLFPFIMFEKTCGAFPRPKEIEMEIFFNKEALKEFINREPRPVDHSYSTYLPVWFDLFDQNSKYGERNKEAIKLVFTLFERTGSPIFQLTSTVDWGSVDFENAPELQKINFQKVIDPYTAYQEIRMYLASMARPEKGTVTISDKDKAQQYGFDKFSFKTMKGDKKPRSKNRGKNS